MPRKKDASTKQPRKFSQTKLRKFALTLLRKTFDVQRLQRLEEDEQGDLTDDTAKLDRPVLITTHRPNHQRTYHIIPIGVKEESNQVFSVRRLLTYGIEYTHTRCIDIHTYIHTYIHTLSTPIVSMPVCWRTVMFARLFSAQAMKIKRLWQGVFKCRNPS